MKKLFLIFSLVMSTIYANAQFGQKNNFIGSFDDARKSLAYDYDNDGDLDIIKVCEFKIYLIDNLGGSFGPQNTILTYSDISTSFVDFDLDGDLDVVAASGSLGEVVWFENLGSMTLGPKQFISLSQSFPNAVHAFDMDTDGDIDVVCASDGFDEVVWFENLGGGNYSTPNILSSSLNCGGSGGYVQVSSADIDNDGNLDIVFSSYLEDGVWFKNLGGGNYSTEQVIYSYFSYQKTRALLIEDFDQDGDLDILSGHDNDGLILHENDGLGNFNNHITLDANGLWISSAFAGDLDGDLDLDIFYNASYSSELFWIENLGYGSYSSRKLIDINVNYGNSEFMVKVNAADLDGDSDLELLSFGSQSNWYENHFDHKYKLKGYVYFDLNQNGIYDPLEIGLDGIKKIVSPNQLAFLSSPSGNYHFSVDTGTYIVSYLPDPLWNLTSDSASFNRTLTGANPIEDSLNFGFFPNSISTLINPDLTGSFPRCNQINNYWINIKNLGTTTPSGIIQLQLDDSINFVSAAISPDSIIGRNLYWHYDSIFYFSSEVINIQVQMPSFTSMGDTLVSIITVTELDGLGNVIYTNVDSLNEVLVCAYDPNDKSVSPKGVGIEGFISQNQELEYLIRFQNTGNDTAITVTIKDTIDVNLNENSMTAIASSHPVEIWLGQNNEAVFKFENIMLPDSGSDFLGSQGFVKFSIQPETGLDPLTQIHNTGNIYFDFNPAVITNMVLNTIECYSAPQPTITFTFPFLNSGITGNYTYQWYLNDTLIVGANQTQFQPTVNGQYTVEVIDSNTCSKISAPYSLINVGIKEISGLKSVVFPNPFNETTTILFNERLNNNFELIIYNLLGKETYRITDISSNKIEIHKNDVGKGIFIAYLININTGDRLLIDKLIVK